MVQYMQKLMLGATLSITYLGFIGMRCSSFPGANGMLPDPDAHKTDLITLKPRDFFSKVVNGDPDGHQYYFTAPVMNLTPKLLPEVEEWPSLDLQEGKGVEPWKCIRPYISVWIGGKDVTTQAHYDVANNVFVQVGVAVSTTQVEGVYTLVIIGVVIDSCPCRLLLTMLKCQEYVTRA